MPGWRSKTRSLSWVSRIAPRNVGVSNPPNLDTRRLTVACSIATIGTNGIESSDGAIVLINGENHYGMRFVRSNPRATTSSCLAGLVLALVFGGERACAEALPSAPYAANAHDQICNCGTRCRHESCCCGRGSATRGGSEESEPGSFPQGERRSGPCLGNAPCEDPVLPSSTPPSSSGTAAALALTAGIQPATTGNLLASPRSCHHHPRWLSRIDRPPRPCRSA